MWYDDLEYNDADYRRSFDVEEAQTDEYWRRLEQYWYQSRPHTLDKDFEELNTLEVEQLKRNYEEYLECTYNPEKFYMTGGV